MYAISVLAALHPASSSSASDQPTLPTQFDPKQANPKAEAEDEVDEDDMEKGYVDSGIVVSAGPSRRGTGTTVSSDDAEIGFALEDSARAVQLGGAHARFSAEDANETLLSALQGTSP